MFQAIAVGTVLILLAVGAWFATPMFSSTPEDISKAPKEIELSGKPISESKPIEPIKKSPIIEKKSDWRDRVYEK